MTQITANFSSVKLPSALVNHAREAAQPLRRSVSGQVEYWATLGQIVESSGLTAQEARAAIELYERQTDRVSGISQLDVIESTFLKAGESGSLARKVREVVLKNRSKNKVTKKTA